MQTIGLANHRFRNTRQNGLLWLYFHTMVPLLEERDLPLFDNSYTAPGPKESQNPPATQKNPKTLKSSRLP